MTTTPDPLTLLEERIENLVGRLESFANENTELRRHSAELEELYGEELKTLREKNQLLTEQATNLQNELQASDEREDRAVQRLRNMLKRIDAMEEAQAKPQAAAS